MRTILDWLILNKDWVFDGLGVVILTGGTRFFWRLARTRSRRRTIQRGRTIRWQTEVSAGTIVSGAPESHTGSIMSAGDTVVIGQIVNTSQAANIDPQGTDSQSVNVDRILPLVASDERVEGCEATISNHGAQDTWIDIVDLMIRVDQHSPCSGNLNVRSNYALRVTAAGVIESSTPDGAVRQKLKGTVAEEETQSRYRLEGEMDFSDDCAYRRWRIKLRFPVSAWVPAHGRARLQLSFDIEGSVLIKHETKGGWAARTNLGTTESWHLTFTTREGNTFAGDLECQLIAPLINRIIELGRLSR